MMHNYRVEYDKIGKVYSVRAPDGLVVSTHSTLAGAVLAAESYGEAKQKNTKKARIAAGQKVSS